MNPPRVHHRRLYPLERSARQQCSALVSRTISVASLDRGAHMCYHMAMARREVLVNSMTISLIDSIRWRPNSAPTDPNCCGVAPKR